MLFLEWQPFLFGSVIAWLAIVLTYTDMNLNYLIICIKRSSLKELCCIFRDKGNDSDDNSDTGNTNGDNELPSLESVFSDGSEASLKNRGKNIL